MVEGGMKFVKYLVFFFNFLFVVSGIALVALGGVIKGYYTKYLDFFGEGVVGVPVLLIIIGVIIFLVAFLGCCGAVRENHCMILSFSILLGIIFVLELSAGIAAYVMRNDLRSTLNEKMGVTMTNFEEEGHDGVTATWNGLQKELDCCGVRGYNDWAATNYGTSTNGSVPDSCCQQVSEGCGTGMALLDEATAANSIHVRGCLARLEQEAKDNIAAVAGVGVGIAFLQILGIVLACLLARSIKKGYETV